MAEISEKNKNDTDFLDQKWQQMTKNRQIIGKQGLYFVSFALARHGLNATIASRDTKDADIIVYNDD